MLEQTGSEHDLRFILRNVARGASRLPWCQNSPTYRLASEPPRQGLPERHGRDHLSVSIPDHEGLLGL